MFYLRILFPAFCPNDSHCATSSGSGMLSARGLFRLPRLGRFWLLFEWLLLLSHRTLRCAAATSPFLASCWQTGHSQSFSESRNARTTLALILNLVFKQLGWNTRPQLPCPVHFTSNLSFTLLIFTMQHPLSQSPRSGSASRSFSPMLSKSIAGGMNVALLPILALCAALISLRYCWSCSLRRVGCKTLYRFRFPRLPSVLDASRKYSSFSDSLYLRGFATAYDGADKHFKALCGSVSFACNIGMYRVACSACFLPLPM